MFSFFLTAINKSVTSTYIGLNKDKNFFTGVVLRSLVALLYVLLFNNDIYTLLLNSLLFGELFYFLYWVLTKNSIKIKFSSIDRLLITEQLKFGIKQLPTSLSDEATYRVDILIIAVKEETKKTFKIISFFTSKYSRILELKLLTIK